MNTRTRLPRANQTMLALDAWTAFDALARGIAGRDEWQSICDAINTVEALADMGKIDADRWMQIVGDACMAMVEAMENFRAGRSMMTNAAGLKVVLHLMDEYDAALERFSATTIIEARRLVVEKIVNARKGSTQEVMVVE